ncbi:MAG TPA: PIN domain-containing protein [Thermoanaerobaculia bacterium]
MPSRRVFLDTNGWIALLSSSDSLHVHAQPLWTELVRQDSSILLTDWVAAETGNGLARTLARAHFPNAVELIRSSSQVQWITITDDLFRRALQRYAERHDKSWGLVDCASFVVMEDHGVQEAFTNDRHFMQAGFRTLLPIS